MLGTGHHAGIASARLTRRMGQPCRHRDRIAPTPAEAAKSVPRLHRVHAGCC